jgi:hydrogenase maturation protein HypF
MHERYFIHVSGIVQGVGFRPFVYQLAIHHHLSGWVMNSSEGVKIDVQGEPGALKLFIRALSEQPPSLARVDQVHYSKLLPDKPQGFEIYPSRIEDNVAVCVSPDQSVCPECLAEMNDAQSRYYRYPFINCTHCGPRYTIIENLPYDRGHTTMKKFDFCPSCHHAYQDPINRRYHAQPTSCHHCGPVVSLRNCEGAVVVQENDVFLRAAQILKSGGVLAVKGLGGFHLVCDATQSQAVNKLRMIKRRQRKPFAVMVDSVETAELYVTGEAAEWQALTSRPAPIVLMKQESGYDIAPEVTLGSPYLGVMLPYTPLHNLLFEQCNELAGSSVLVMTSGNVSGMPLATELSEIQQQIGRSLDGILDHNRPIANACDDSVVHLAGGSVRMLRLARGYAPLSRKNRYEGAPMMALGAQQKSTAAMALAGQWIISPYIGDLDDIDTQQRYEQTLGLFQNLYRCKPQQWICDEHSGYFSTQHAVQQMGEVLRVQHHHAHILAVMAEYQLTGPVLGFAFDGTGAGDDHTVWGGEVLLADTRGYQRRGFLRPFRLIGGEKAIREPARILFAMLLECYSLADIQALNHPAFRSWRDEDFSNLHQLWLSGTHSPLCSSVGRMFDAWACLCDLFERPDFDGESGLLIEAAAMQSHDSIPLDLTIGWDEQQQILDWEKLFKVSLESKCWQSRNDVAATCQGMLQSLVDVIVQIAKEEPSLPVIVSGGVFQNRLLMNGLWQSWEHSTQPLYSGTMVPVNDSGIAIGQLWYGVHQS